MLLFTLFHEVVILDILVERTITLHEELFIYLFIDIFVLQLFQIVFFHPFFHLLLNVHLLHSIFLDKSRRLSLEVQLRLLQSLLYKQVLEQLQI